MKIPVDAILLEICQEIQKYNWVPEKWIQHESDDMFQIGNYQGGFDAIEKAFCFSVFIDNIEYWFQLTLDEIHKVIDRSLTTINLRVAGC
jgi:hypothetical protein